MGGGTKAILKSYPVSGVEDRINSITEASTLRKRAIASEGQKDAGLSEDISNDGDSKSFPLENSSGSLK